MDSVDRRSFLKAGAAGLAALPAARAVLGVSLLDELPGAYGLQAVPFTSVDITDAFWRPRMEANRAVSLQHCFDRFEGGNEFSVSKLVEAAAYVLTKRPDTTLQAYVDQRVDRMVAAIDRRIENPQQAVRVSGHFFEAAVAYHQATGNQNILNAARRAADQIDQGYGPGKATYISGHEGLKIGLIALYQATGEERYYRLARFFADERGKDDYPRTGEYARDRTYAQDHMPVVKQKDAVGHCVRATFLYIPMTDIAALDQSKQYRTAVHRIWSDAIERKTYVTGGIGSIRFHEKYGAAYELPNLSAWNETCAAYGNVVWNHRLFLLERDAKYIDVMERVLYNALLVGVSLSGDRFFYQNPLISFGDYARFEWINTPCCPPNVVRLIASLGSYLYANDERNLYVNLFADSSAKVNLAGSTVRIRQETRYPWDGKIRLSVDPATPAEFTVHVRAPGWLRGEVMPGELYECVNARADNPRVTVNGAAARNPVDDRGYLQLNRRWQAGDVVEIDLPMPVREITARAEVKDDRRRAALQRGPLVYCAEWPDNNGHALNIVVPPGATFGTEFRPDLLGGVQVITGSVQAIERADGSTRVVPHRLIAIPYYAWANRGMGEMAVWLARDPDTAWIAPVLPDSIARIMHSGGVQKGWTGYNDQNDDLGAVYDGREPLNSADQSHRFFRMRPPVGQPAWLQYDFKQPMKISSTRVYFFDDKRFCKLPASWRLLYLGDEDWKPVDARRTYQVKKDAYSEMAFTAVMATAVRIEVEPQTVAYKSGDIGPPAAMFLTEDTAWREFGVIEWEVK
ncbi:MAG: beta-L-arabinofuranosidase domain-containing protein [Gemmatimonadota bacterium]